MTLRRKTPLRSNPEKAREWQQRSRAKQANKLKFIGGKKKINNRSVRRRSQETTYGELRRAFLKEHRICPVTGQETTEIHHSAKREGNWLNLQRYWIALSADGHKWVEENKAEAEKHGLMVRIREPYQTHVGFLNGMGASLTTPIFYTKWDNKTLNLNH